MRKPITLALVVFILSLCFLGCEQTPPPQNLNQQANQAVSPNEVKSKTLIWPYLSEHQPDYVQSNLTAKNYVLIFDGSGSMGESGCSDGRDKIGVAKEAVIEWYKTIPLKEANVGLVAFHGKWTTLDLTLKKDATNFISVINSISPDGNTPLATAIKLSYGMLTKQAQRQLGYGEYVIVVVTDGENNDKHESLKKWVAHVLQTPIRIYTIGFCIKGDHSLNQPGRTIYREANNPQELRKGLQEVLAEAERFDLAVFK